MIISNIEIDEDEQGIYSAISIFGVKEREEESLCIFTDMRRRQ